jgi:hypothetical protein
MKSWRWNIGACDANVLLQEHQAIWLAKPYPSSTHWLRKYSTFNGRALSAISKAVFGKNIEAFLDDYC